MDSELGIYFPERYSSDAGEELQYYSNLKRRIVAELELIVDNENESQKRQYQSAMNYFANIAKPKVFSSSINNILIQQEKQFEDLVCVLEDNGTHNAKELTVFELMKRVEFIERKYKTEK